MLFYLFCLSCALVAYTWAGYPLLLKALRKRPRRSSSADGLPTITVLLTVRNGEGRVAPRLQDILSQDYPVGRMRVFVASDGSNDRTIDEATSTGDPRVVAKQFPCLGKSATQNAAFLELSDDIVVFTDVDTRFAPGFLNEIVRPFSDPEVGCVSGSLMLQEKRQAIAEGQSLYWRFEMWLRAQESRVGLLSTATGACMACRRVLLRPLMPGCGEDCTVPLDIVERGYIVVHAEKARAYDEMPDTLSGELNARARMTCRNLRGTISHACLLNPFRRPGHALALWSHKMLRWMTPLFFISAGLSSMLLYTELKIFVWTVFLILAFSGLGLAFHASDIRQPRILSLPFSFIVANFGFLLGIMLFLRGADFASYQNTSPTVVVPRRNLSRANSER